MKKVGALCLAVFILFCCLPVSAADSVEDASVISGCNTLDAHVPVLGSQQLTEDAAAMFLYETNSDTLMYAYNPDMRLPPASLLKILTALIVIEKGNMTDVVTVKRDVLATISPDAAVSGLIADEVLTVKDLLYCMMVASGNDAAVVLADYVMGDQKAFVAEMNRYAEELGCTDTNFTNVHGLHDPNQYTSARDVGRFLVKALQNERFSTIFGAKYYAVPATNKSGIRHLYTQNYLLSNSIYYDSRVTGSRTAIAYDLTRNIASVAKVNDMSLVCVVMGAESEYDTDGYSVKVYGGYNETKQLLDLGFSGYKSVQILHPKQVLKQCSVTGGDCDVSIGTTDGAFSVIPDHVNPEDLVYRYIDEETLTAPIKNGQRLSTVQVWCGTLCIIQKDLYALNSVESIASVSIDDPPANGKTNFWNVFLYVLGAVLVIALLTFVILSVLRAVRLAKVRKRRRRISRNRRRSR